MRAPSSFASSRAVDRSAERLRHWALAFRSWRFARGPTQPKSAPKGEGLSLKVSYACGRTAIRGGSYDRPREAQRLGLGREDPRGLDRTGGNDRDHGSPL